MHPVPSTLTALEKILIGHLTGSRVCKTRPEMPATWRLLQGRDNRGCRNYQCVCILSADLTVFQISLY